MVMDAHELVIDEPWFKVEDDWKTLYCEAEDESHLNMSQLLGKSVSINVFVDASQANNVVTRMSHTGILIKVNNAPVIWYSKRQNSVESSSFGSEFVAMRIAVDTVEALRYKLRMFGVPLFGPANVIIRVTNAASIGAILCKRSITQYVIIEFERHRRWK